MACYTETSSQKGLSPHTVVPPQSLDETVAIKFFPDSRPPKKIGYRKNVKGGAL